MQIEFESSSFKSLSIQTPPPPRLNKWRSHSPVFFEITRSDAVIQSDSARTLTVPSLRTVPNEFSYEFSGDTLKLKCPNTKIAVEVLKRTWLIYKYNNLSTAFLIKINVQARLELPNTTNIFEIFEKITNKISIILFESSGSKSQMFWKFGNGKIFTINFDAEFSDFLVNFLESSLKFNGHSGISLDTLSILRTCDEICELELHALADFRDFNLLMLAAEHGDENAVNFLIKEGFDVNCMVLEQTAVDLAWKHQHFDIVLILLNANSVFPSKFNFKEATDEIKEFVKITRNLHNCIRKKKIKEIEIILEQNNHLRHFYTTQNISAATKAAFYGYFNIYDLILSHNVFIGPKEDIHLILNKINRIQREEIREINLKYIQNWTEKHLMILVANSFVGHDVPDVDQKLEHVTKAFEYLNEAHPLISQMLKVVAASRDFKIIFDFQRESVQYLDPTADRHTRGIYHTTRHIYVASSQMLEPAKKLQGYGTLAHELCHYAMHLIYHNNCRPYYSNDDETIRRFSAITFLCLMRCQKEALIAMVFQNYPNKTQHAELIVRVPHILVEYSQNDQSLNECYGNFSELFDFYEQITAVDMENSHSTIEIEADAKIQKFADRARKQKRHICGLWMFALLTASIPFILWLTLSMVEMPIYSCGNLTDELRIKVLDSTVDFQGMNVIFSDLFGNNLTACQELSSSEIMNMLNVYDSDEIIRSNDEILENEVLNKTKIVCEKYIDHPVVLEPIEGKIKGNINLLVPSLKVGEKVDLKTKFYVERKISGIKSNEISKMEYLILSDGPGSGKSSAFRHLTWKLKQTYPLKWIIYVDMKLHSYSLKQISNFYSSGIPVDSDSKSIFQNITSNETNLQINKTAIFDFLISKIFNLTSKTDRKIFKEKFFFNQVIFLWDGFDEVSPYSMEQSLDLFDAILKSTGNYQWFSTRPGFENEIRSRLDIPVYKLEPYDEDKRREFITKFFESNGMTAKNITIAIKKINEFTERLERQRTDKSEKQVINSPLMLSMICKAYYYMSFKLDHTTNLYSFYEFFVDQLFDIVQKDKGDVVKNDTNRIERQEMFRGIHQFYAVNDTTRKYVIQIDVASLGIQKLNVKWANENISRYGILFPGPNGKLNFDHRTYKEFFFAQYFYDNLWNLKYGQVSLEEARWRLRHLFSIIDAGENFFKVVMDFIVGFTEAHAGDTDDSFNEQVSYLMRYEFKDLLFSYFRNIKKIEFVTKFFKKDQELLKIIWKVDENKSVFLDFIGKYPAVGDIYCLKGVVERHFNSQDAQKIFKGKFQSINFLYIIWTKNSTEFTKNIKNVTGFGLDFEVLPKIYSLTDFLKFIDMQNFSTAEFREFFFTNLFDQTAQLKMSGELTFLWELSDTKLNMQDVKTLIMQKNGECNLTHLFYLNQKDEKFVRFFLNFARYHLDKHEIVDLLLHRSHCIQETFLTYSSTMISSGRFIEVMWNFTKDYLSKKQLKYILTASSELQTLHKIFKTSKNEAFFQYKKIYTEIFQNNEIKEMMKQLDKIGKSIMFYILASQGRVQEDPTEKLEFIEEIFRGDIEGLRKLLFVKSKGMTFFKFHSRGSSKFNKDRLKPFEDLALNVLNEDELKLLYA